MGLLPITGWASEENGNIAAVCPYTLPLDAHPAAAAYSFRVLAADWIKNNLVKLRRSSDSATKIFTASAQTCGIDTHDPFFDGSTYTLQTWYDQSGHNADVRALSESAEPIVSLGCLNGQPCGVYNGVDRYLTGTLSSAVGPDTFAAVANLASDAGGKYIALIGTIYANDTSINFSHSSKACVSLRWGNKIPSKEAIPCKVNNWYRWIATQNSVLSSVYLNGVAGSNDTVGNTESHASLTLIPSTAFYIGESSDFANRWQGEIAELIVFSPDLSRADSDAVSTNQGNYWGL